MEEAAKCILSGGAHPIFMHDDRLTDSLLQSKIRGDLSISDTRNYACDGCYEPMLAGSTEFAFATVSTLQVLEYAINSGAAYQMSSNIHSR